MSGYDWYVYDRFVGNSLEWEFMKFIESQKNEIDKAFSHWYIIRNERMSEFAVYEI
ncbi:MAG: hypothetical protein K2P17_00370 [Helicobacteraceae bacterium]|nr:hypothetical protein [Helicobacteraceae bacterium]